MSIEKVYRRVINLVRYGKQSTPSTYRGGIQYTQISRPGGLESLDLPVVQQFGFASHATVGCDAVSIHIAGDQSNGVIIGSNDQRFTPHLASGEAEMYDSANQYIFLSNGTKIIIKANQEVDVIASTLVSVTAPTVIVNATTSVTVTSPNVNVNGNLNVTGTSGGAASITFNGNINCTGTITATGDIVGQGISLHGHVHGGVLSGGSNTGLPH